MGQDIERLKATVDLRDEIGKVLTPIHVEARLSKFPCTFHNERTPGAFTVYADGFHCFSCGAKGDVFDWLEHHYGMDLTEAIEYLDGGAPPSPAEAARIAAVNAERQAQRLEEQIITAQEALDKLREAQKWLDYHRQLDAISRDLWRQRGIQDDFWMDEWKLGYNPEYKLWQKKGDDWQVVHKSPALTIPVWGHNWEVNNIKHRLLIPGDHPKYMQESKGVKAQSFIANPELCSGPAIVVEGEIKAMNTFITYDSDKMQVVGLPAAMPDDYALAELDCHDLLYLIMDPDTYNRRDDGTIPIVRLAEKLGRERVRHIRLNGKIDDMIIEYGLDKTWLRSVVNQARPFS